MRLVVSFAMAIFAIAPMALPASAQDDTQRVGEWDIVSRPQPGKRLDHVCVATSPRTESQARLQLVNVLDDDDTVSQRSRGAALVNILISSALIDTPTAMVEGVSVSIPGQKTWPARVAAWDGAKGSGGKLVMTLEDQVDRIIPPLSKGSELSISIPMTDGTMEKLVVDLKGSGRALGVFESCLSKVTWVAPG